MQRIFAAIGGLLILCWLGRGAALAAGCEPDGVQASGSIYRICMPDAGAYNDRLVIWAHGFQDAGTPLAIPENQLRAKDFSIQEFVTGLGFGFATNSYSKTGLAVRQGMADLLDLVRRYAAGHGNPERVYLIGASEGGLITALLVEQHPEVFTGGLAACGPVGDFSYQLQTIGDARATFEVFFPGLIPDRGDPLHPTADLIAAWDAWYAETIAPELLAPANRRDLNQWARVAKLVQNPAAPRATKAQSGGDLLGYAVKNLNDAVATLGGMPYGNEHRRYRGAADDAALNAQVPRVAADPRALEEMRAHYDTSGQLHSPLVTLHSTRDSLVPYRHERLYLAKTRQSGAYRKRHFNIQTSAYGHCQFSSGEVLLALATLGTATGEASFIDNLALNTLDDTVVKEYRDLARRNRLQIDLPGGKLRIRLPGG